MAESQESPGSEASQDAGTGQVTDGFGDTTSSDLVTDASSQSQPSTELDEITRTVSAGGEKAVEMVKHWQRVASEKDSKLASFKPVEDLFTQFGQGDVAKGAEAAQLFLNQYSNVVNHPEAREAITTYLQTGEWKPKGTSTDDLSFEDDDVTDPVQENLQALQKEVRELRGGSAMQQMKGHLDGFFKKEMTEGVSLGDVLNDEEKSKIVSGLEGHIQRLAANEAGQGTLRTMNAQMVQQMMQMQIPPEQWVTIGERAHLQKIERKKGAATGAAPQGSTTGNEDRAYSENLTTALSEWCRENGIDPYNMNP